MKIRIGGGAYAQGDLNTTAKTGDRRDLTCWACDGTTQLHIIEPIGTPVPAITNEWS